MKRIIILSITLIGLCFGCSKDYALKKTNAKTDNIKYLAFQLFISGSTEPTGDYQPLNGFISPDEVEKFFIAVQSAVGKSSDPSRKPAVMIGPIALDFTNNEIATLINQSFKLAIHYDIAVGFHIDDGKFWAGRPDLWKNPDNVEWIDWNGTPNTSAGISWVSSRLAPQMCFNSPMIKMAMHDFMTNIAMDIQSNLAQLESVEKEYLYAGVIVGWEPGIYPDRDTKMLSGYHALRNKGFAANDLPADADQERVNILHEYMEWISEPFGSQGLPVSKTYSHTVFLPRNFYDSFVIINPDFGKETYAEVNSFSLPEIALGSHYSPGFSTYPLHGILDTIHALLPNAGWASSEGTNMIPDMPPAPSGFNMESYLARHYNYGCQLVNIFAFHIHGDPFTDALNSVTEGADAITAYKKFLNGGVLKE